MNVLLTILAITPKRGEMSSNYINKTLSTLLKMYNCSDCMNKPAAKKELLQTYVKVGRNYFTWV